MTCEKVKCPVFGLNLVKNTPSISDIYPGSRWYCSPKIGGERQLVNVIATSSPYPKDFGKGRKMMHVDVFGYEGSWTVPVKQLFTVHPASPDARSDVAVQETATD